MTNWIKQIESTLSEAFLKRSGQCPSLLRSEIERCAFEELPKATSVYVFGKAEKMKGYKGFYKIRFGDYRVGLEIDGNNVILKRVLHRKEIYRYFP